MSILENCNNIVYRQNTDIGCAFTYFLTINYELNDFLDKINMAFPVNSDISDRMSSFRNVTEKLMTFTHLKIEY